MTGAMTRAMTMRFPPACLRACSRACLLAGLRACWLACLLTGVFPMAAHVGSPDVFFAGDAGPYKLLVTIRPPQVVPGGAEIEIRSFSPGARRIHIVPLRLAQPGVHPGPVPDLARPARE